MYDRVNWKNNSEMFFANKIDFILLYLPFLRLFQDRYPEYL